ncbi:MAG: PQQ-dependent sugar dehydrogenase [Acidimicrobiales bacterium]|nr:PQQ-dependent sugar dehydrogenase [Acidimicrobiales bacterium]
MRQVLIGLVALALLAGACGDDGDGQSTTEPAGSDAVPTTTGPTDDDEGGGVADLSDAAVSLTPVVELDWPTALATRAGSDHLYVAERAGRVVVVERSERGLGTIGDELIDIRDETTIDGERGLLGLTFDPTGERLYLSYTDLAGDTRLDEWTMDGDEPDETTRRTIFTLEQPTEFHNGGQVSFGPDDLLYLGLGDGARGDDPSQNPDTPLGSLLRIDPSEAGDEPYTIPDDNPFADGGGAPEIWAMGLRNPWRYSWDRATGDLWIADVGQDRIEEVNVVPAPDDGSPAGRAANFGWAIFEGNEPFDGGPEPENYVPPIETYPRDPGCSVIGGYVSRGDALPDLMGVYVYTDLCDARLRLLLQRDGEPVETRTLDDVTVPGGQPVSFGEGPDAELYVMSLVGGVFRLDPA